MLYCVDHNIKVLFVLAPVARNGQYQSAEVTVTVPRMFHMNCNGTNMKHDSDESKRSNRKL